MAVKAPPTLSLAAAPRRIGSSAIRDLLAVTERPEIISLAGGLPAPSAFPADTIAAVTAEVLATDPTSALQYSTTAGDTGLRAWVAERLGIDAERDDVVITHGSQQAIELLTRALIDPGDVVALADPAYVGALQAFRLCGASLLGLPSDADGLCVDALADQLASGARPSLVYVVSTFDNPTGAVLSAERRRALAALADRYGFLVIDDDPYSELRWSAEPLTPLRELSDRVVTLGTTSKVLCPGLRVGWVAAPAALAATLVIMKQAVDLQTATFTQRIARGVLERPGFLTPHLARLRAIYEAQSVALCDALDRELGDCLDYDRPRGGMFVWARAPGIDTERLLALAIDAGTAFVPGSAFAVTPGVRDTLRLSFATATEPELATAVARLRTALTRV